MISSPHSALYLSVPFCRTKCSFCNFASGVFRRDLLDRYVAHLEQAIAAAPALAAECGAAFDPLLDSIYLGGGTPSILAPDQLDRIFAAIASVFTVAPQAEITVEVAPGTLSCPGTPTAGVLGTPSSPSSPNTGGLGTPTPEVLAALLRAGVNRISLGVQSFVDQEARAVGRLHTCEIALADIDRLREAGITNLSVDLIAGLPHQTAESWERSLDQTIALDLPHASIYMLEVDADSRLGRELIAGGTRYHAHHVPDEALTVALYERACERLNHAGVVQYEISNFARPGRQSRHNLRYWQRLPYYGFGVDAHSMLPAPTAAEPHRAVRLAAPDSLEAFLASPPIPLGGPHSPSLWANVGSAPFERTMIGERQAIEETYFLGLRMNCGVELAAIQREFGRSAVDGYSEPIADLISRGLLEVEGGWLRLTAQGRLLSNEVFAAFLPD